MKANAPVRIAVVIPKYGLVGGGEKLAAELTERIARRFPCLFDRTTIHVERRMVLNEKAIFLPVSGIARDRFVAEYPHCSGRTEVLHPGVDTAAFDASDRARCRREIRGQNGWREEDAVLLFVGMNFELKGLDPLITAAGRAKAAAQGRPLKLLVVGKGSESRYRSLARSAGLGDDVHFTGVRRERMEDLYLASDFYAMLSTFDTFGMTVLEAMAASLPVIVSPGVGARDLVREGVNGFIVPREDIETITARILLLLDREKRGEMGTAAREVAQAHTWDAMAQRITELYEEILAAKSC